ncbi:MAG: succinate dehydrogenase hydrophobic membrane anchor protein [Streptosporangiales bacterium]|nr:succinate dehydrogenase hydrophobic membrane anchor protein [Streptosporangiales bacterium]
MTKTMPAARRAVLSYLMVRVTGLLLAVLVTGHFAVTHIVNDVAATDASFIAERWSTVLWVVWDGLLLACALSHGASGVWVAIDDYVRPGRRRPWRSALVALTAVLLAFGVTVLVVGAAS